MENETSLGIVLEMLEIQKKRIMDETKNYPETMKKLQELEDERKKIISGDIQAMKRIEEKYNREYIDNK